MKRATLACALLIVASITLCAAKNDKFWALYEISHKEIYKNTLDISKLIPISLNEAEDVLNTLRKKENATYTYKVSPNTHNWLILSNKHRTYKEYTFTLKHTTASYGNNNCFYDKDFKAYALSFYFKWAMSKFELSSVSDETMNKFECNSYLHFKVLEVGMKYLLVPAKPHSDYNSTNHEMKIQALLNFK